MNIYCRFNDQSRKGTDNTPNICDSSQNISEITKEEISRAFKQINVRKASGLSPMFLRACHLELCDIFHTMYNESIMRGKIPVLWNTASIIPVPKTIMCLHICVVGFRTS